jgi:hypothetical protein
MVEIEDMVEASLKYFAGNFRCAPLNVAGTIVLYCWLIKLKCIAVYCKFLPVQLIVIISSRQKIERPAVCWP